MSSKTKGQFLILALARKNATEKTHGFGLNSPDTLCYLHGCFLLNMGHFAAYMGTDFYLTYNMTHTCDLQQQLCYSHGAMYGLLILHVHGCVLLLLTMCYRCSRQHEHKLLLKKCRFSTETFWRLVFSHEWFRILNHDI